MPADLSTEEQPRDRVSMVALLAATGFAWFGNVISLLVVPWLVYQLTGSGSQTGLVGFAAAAPLVLAGMFGGVFIDWIGHARTAAWTEFFSGLFLALIPILHMTTGLNVWMILVLVFVSNLFSAPGMTARRILIPAVAPRAGMPLERANSLEQMMSRFPQLIGPPIAGALMAAFHPANVIWLGVAVVWIAGLSVHLGVRSTETTNAEEGAGSYLADLIDGLRFIAQDRLIRVTALVLACTNLLEAPLSVVGPIYAEEILGGAVDLGLIMAALGSGLLIGAGSFAVFGYRLPRRVVFIVGFLGIGSSYWILATLPGFWVTSTTLFTLGLLAGPVNPLIVTVYQERVPVEMRGRVFGLLSAIGLSMMPLGRLLGGVFIDWIGLAGTLLVQAIGFAFVAVLLLLLPALRLLNETTPASSKAAAADVAGEPVRNTR